MLATKSTAFLTRATAILLAVSLLLQVIVVALGSARSVMVNMLFLYLTDYLYHARVMAFTNLLILQLVLLSWSMLFAVGMAALLWLTSAKLDANDTATSAHARLRIVTRIGLFIAAPLLLLQFIFGVAQYAVFGRALSDDEDAWGSLAIAEIVFWVLYLLVANLCVLALKVVYDRAANVPVHNNVAPTTMAAVAPATTILAPQQLKNGEADIYREKDIVPASTEPQLQPEPQHTAVVDNTELQRDDEEASSVVASSTVDAVTNTTAPTSPIAAPATQAPRPDNPLLQRVV